MPLNPLEGSIIRCIRPGTGTVWVAIVRVNPARILELRRRDGARGYKVVLEPPVNRVLPVSDERVGELRGRFR